MAGYKNPKEHPQVLKEVLQGMKKSQKEVPCYLFYDQKGSQLFEQICAQEEYYLTRTEISIMRDHINAIAACFSPDSLLIEFGSGSGIKTRILLDHLGVLAGYIPVDISETQLEQSTRELKKEYPDLKVNSLCLDYLQPFALPEFKQTIRSRIVYFPGSTIGNFHPEQATAFLKRIRGLCGSEGGLLIGIDLKKESKILHQAYNDQAGVTAAFNKNLLVHLNSRFGAGFKVDQFEHQAFYNQELGRIEMHLMAKEQQQVKLNGEVFTIEKNERIWTESSYKYEVDEFTHLAEQAGFYLKNLWSDSKQYFAVLFFQAAGRGKGTADQS